MTLAQLSALASIDARGMLRLGELASIEGVVPSTMTRLVAGLELAGLVERAPAPDDGRSSLVQATEAGVALLAKLRCDYVSELAERLATLDRNSLERILAAMPALEAIVADSR
jgi:DNA-binding MarR family transcriptional regulator